MDRKDYYSILGVDKNATPEEIKKSFRKLSLQYHPDRLSDKTESERKASEEKFKEITEAYEVLSNPEKRQAYDNPSPFGEGFGEGFSGFDEGMFDMFMDPFGRRNKREKTKGDNTGCNISMTLEEIYNGAEKTITYQKLKKCKHCNGTGSADGKDHKCKHCNGTGRLVKTQRTPFGTSQVVTGCPYCGGTGKDNSASPCPHCGGTGFEKVIETKTIFIPSGVENGTILTIKGEGCESKQSGGENGDLLIQINEIPHPLYKRNGANILYECSVDIMDALHGCKVDIPCINGSKIRISIAELTEDGHVLRVRGKGMKVGSNFGDMIIKINHKLPNTLTEEQKELLVKFQEIEKNK